MSLNHDTILEPDATEELFVDFANTLEYTRGEAEDFIPDTVALLNWLARQGLLSERARASEATRLRSRPREAERQLARFRELRAVLHGIARRMSMAGRPTRSQLREVNRILRNGLHYHQLRAEDGGTRYALAQVGDPLDQARASIASSLAHFLADDAPDRLRVCANDRCRYLFVDRSRTARRRWCDMATCGNQAKAARHRARARAMSPAGAAPRRATSERGLRHR